MKSKETLKVCLKLGLGACLLYYVVYSKMIDFHSVGSFLLRPTNLVVALFFFSFSVLCVTARWYLLAKAQGLSFSFKSMVEITMIGYFFNTFMPGAVGGDVVKAWYVAGEEPKKKTRAIFTVLLDRVIGLSVFFFYSGTTLLFYTDWLRGRPQLQMTAYVVWGFGGGSILFSLLFYSPLLWRHKGFRRFLHFLERWPFLHKVMDAAMLYRHHLRSICMALGLSALSIFGMTLFYKWMGDGLGIPMDLAHYFFVVPIALTVSAVPLLPGGIGVGQVAFFTLFRWSGMSNPEQGGSLCTAMQVYNILFNCLGAFFYLKFKKKPQEVRVTNSVPV